MKMFKKIMKHLGKNYADVWGCSMLSMHTL